MTYTKTKRSKAAKKGWRERKDRVWIDRGVKPIDRIPVGKVSVPIKRVD
jgi:hypothetical protein